MGTRQRAQKRGKSTPIAAKGSLKGSPLSQRKGNSSVQVSSLDPYARSSALLGLQDFSPASSPSDRNGFSMSQIARNTERHAFGWGQVKLRNNAISFVSAGHLHQDELQSSTAKPAEKPSEPSSDEQQTSIQQVEVTVEYVQEAHIEEEVVLQTETLLPTREKQPTLPVATQAEETPSTSKPRSASSSSSELDDIVFVGRTNLSKQPLDSSSKTLSRLESSDRLRAPEVVSTISTNAQMGTTQQSHASDASVSNPNRNVAPSSAKRPPLSQRGRRSRRNIEYVSDEEEAIIQDYIANMAMDDDDDDDDDNTDLPAHMTSKPVRRNETFRFYGGSGEENSKVQIQGSTPARRGRDQDIYDLDQAMDWNSDDLEIFDNMPTSDEEMDDVAQVLRQRERSGKTQYLVMAKGTTIEDAKWILKERLVSTSAVDELRIFEEIQAIEFEEESLDDDDDDDDNDEDESSEGEDEEALNDLIDNIESEDDENAKIMAHISNLTDEQIARMLAKQEELGMDADELMLFGGDVGHDMDNGRGDAVDPFEDEDGFISFSTKNHTSNRGRSKRNKKQRDSFPSAAAFADALDQDPYGGFDVMDFDRPSLRPKKKGRKSDFPYDIELEDEDLKDQIVSTWMKDREKKALRKREKEEARMTAAFDASERGNPVVIRAEIRRFLCQDIDVLRLAPMDPTTRAGIHRLAKALQLNSRSEGKDGKAGGRYPVLTKTARTPMYTISTIWEVDNLMSARRFFPKTAGYQNGPKIPRGTITRTRRSGGVQGATYMNGEVVGASAPELGADNRGRAMLEKMGWSSGMAIGAEGNKGSLEAIKHVVKTTKAGLG